MQAHKLLAEQTHFILMLAFSLIRKNVKSYNVAII